MTTTQEQVGQFLKEFLEKKRVWGILFRDDRGKNAQTLADLEIRPIDREKVLDSIVVLDYSQGPVADILNGGPVMWVFGKMVSKQEVYIKITVGWPGAQVICISFHIAEHAINYPFKTPFS
jgi:hypothetical protein